MRLPSIVDDNASQMHGAFFVLPHSLLAISKIRICKDKSSAYPCAENNEVLNKDKGSIHFLLLVCTYM